MRTANAVCAALLCVAMVHAAQVKVKISSEPAGATIRVGSETCTGSCVLAFEKGSKQTIVATKEGFEEAKSVQTMQRNGQKIVVKLSPKKPTVKTGVLKDKRDGRAYKTVQVEDDWWMAENLAFNVKGASIGAGGNCKRFGRLYDLAATMDLEPDYLSDLAAEFIAEVHQGVCPDGWHVPSEADWSRLIASGDGMQTAGEKLTPDGKLPGPGAQTLFWSARETAARDAQSATLRDGRKELTLGRSSKGSKNAVRCIQDRVGPPPPPKPKPVAKPEPDSHLVREAKYFGHTSIQTRWQGNAASLYPQGEDCLTLNVWTAADGMRRDHRPVMVWIHGGSYVSNGTANPRDWGDKFVKAHPEVVFVS